VKTRFLFSALLMMLLALAGCGQPGAEAPETEAADTAAEASAETPTNEAWEAMIAELRAVETDGEKVDILKAFVTANPNNERTAYALSGVIYYLGEDPAAREEALAFSREALALVTDDGVRREVQLELVSLYAAMADTDALKTAVAELAAAGPLGYADHDRITGAALEARAWGLAAEHAEASLGMATAEAYRADYPDRTFTDEQVTDAVANRKTSALTHKGWALANLDRVDEALAAFEAGSGNVSRNYVGIPEVPLYSYWGRTLAEAGQHGKAMEMLAADAVLGNDEEALDALHGAYVALNGEAGFEDYLRRTRQGLAKTIDDFTLNNYQGEPLTMSSLKGQVVLLSFWFPT
jgi:predicted small lipoprotein YifL